MKVQINVLGTRYADIRTGETFIYVGVVYIKTNMPCENMYRSVDLKTGFASPFYDDTVVTPVKLMVVPEE